MNNPIPLVGIVMGSDSDWPIMKQCAETFKRFGIAYEAKVLSAHRTPDAALDYAAIANAVDCAGGYGGPRTGISADVLARVEGDGL